MRDICTSALDAALNALPSRYPGAGGVAGVVKDGQVIARRAWGYADLATAVPMTAQTRLPICSISKQFTCAVLLAEFGTPEALDDKLAALLPNFRETLPTVRQLCDNQSGLRDYWALTVLHGARAEQVFSRPEGPAVLARMQGCHFAPGHGYSYCNGNFRLLSELIEPETGATMEELYRRHIWAPAGMETAVLTSDTRYPADGVVGYEGSEETGSFPAENGIFWVGDAGISASLEDMLAYECWIDRTRDDAQSLYRRISAPAHFADGAPASYGLGLTHETIGDVAFTGHPGALRGFRAKRLNARDERLSVVVMFNHEGSAAGAAEDIARAALGQEAPELRLVEGRWAGTWLASDGLLVRITQEGGRAHVDYAGAPEPVGAGPDGSLVGSGLTLLREGEGLRMIRPGDNSDLRLTPVPAVVERDPAAIAGRFHCAELDAWLEIEARDHGVYARAEGMLGTGPMERLAQVGPDCWILVTRRSLDAPAPGNWTILLQRDEGGRVTGLTVGCWLARGLSYRRAAS